MCTFERNIGKTKIKIKIAKFDKISKNLHVLWHLKPNPLRKTVVNVVNKTVNVLNKTLNFVNKTVNVLKWTENVVNKSFSVINKTANVVD